MLDMISHSSSDVGNLSLDGNKKENWEDDDDFNDNSWLYGSIKG